MLENICVFCASSNNVSPVYLKPAAELGRLLAARHITLLYGGGKAGLMGELSRAVHAGGGKITGIIPALFRERGWCYEKADRIIQTRTMQERKQIMEEMGQAFIALPGGTGTLDEILEILTTKQLGFHAKPLVLINTRGFFNPLLRYFTRLFKQGFVHEPAGRYLQTAADARSALDRVLKG
ncbi:MAG: TIGR00730 family Rossman fold protein [Spirochaetia bacterium]|jgi:uncharacterized protein (TIGR00730 family)